MSIRRAFWIFALFTVLTTIADRILFIILPLYLIDLSFSATQIGLIFSIAGLFLAFFRFLIGKLSDLKGRKRMMSLALLIDSIATMFYPAVTTITQFSLVRGAKDIAHHMTSTLQDVMLGDSFPRRIRLRMLSRLGTIFPMGRALAAITGFLIVTYLSIAFGFYVAAISLFLAFLIFTIFYREKMPASLKPFKFSTKNISKPLMIISLIGISNSLSFTIAYYPAFFVLSRSLGLVEADLFLMFLLTYIISSFFAWRTENWIRKHGRKTILGLTSLGYGPMTMLYAFSSTIYLFYLALLGVAISFYVFKIAFKTILIDSTNKQHRGEQVGFSKMVTAMGGIAGPVTGGLLIDLVSLQSAFLVAGMFGIIGFLLSIILKRK
jgi:MFS family permease